MEETANRAEAERLLGIAEKLLLSKDFNGSKEFAILAQETEPLLDGSDQILAVSEVQLASEKRINNQFDWYAILQLDLQSNDLQIIRQQYRRLALFLHPDRNQLAFADSAFRLVSNAWAVLSDPTKKSLYDNEVRVFSKVDLEPKQNEFHQWQIQSPVSQSFRANNNSVNNGGDRTRNATAGAAKLLNFWTACPYCYNLYEYARVYEECCLRCQNCHRAFTAAEITSLPPFAPGKEAYYCSWSFFPMGITFANSEIGKGGVFPNWMPMMFPSFGINNRSAAATNESNVGASEGGGGFVNVAEGNVQLSEPLTKKRGRPKKNAQV